MARKKLLSVTSSLRSFLNRLWRRSDRAAIRLPHRKLRHIGFESLESRAMLAADLGSISGLVYQDLDGDGYDGAEAVNNAIVRLYSDDGDSTFEPGAGDTLLFTTNADVNGEYKFNGLAAGSYWVEQPSQPGNVGTLPEVSHLVAISVAQATQGAQATLIDDFDAVSTLIVDTVPVDAVPATGTVANAAILGGELDLSALLTTGPNPTDNVSIQSGGGVAAIGSSSGGAGTYNMTWDGADGDAATLDPTGLGGVDLTANDGLAFRLAIAGFDQTGGTAVLRVYTDAGNWSSSPVINIPANTTGDLTVRYADFVTGGGTGADFTNVGAIQLEVVGVAAMDGQIGLVSSVAEAVITQDFQNGVADLSLTKTVDNATPNKNDNITYTITLSNGGPLNATGVQVTDLLPAGLTFVSSNPSQGTYDDGTGVWTVGSVASGANAILEIVATAATLDVKSNVAEVTAADQADPDSTPNDGEPDDDDYATVDVTPQEADLSLTKTVDDATPNVGDQVTFTITAANAGPDAATNVAVTDLLPAGLAFVSSTPSQGSYVDGTGIWTVGTINSGSNATLLVVATVTSLGTKINGAEVTASDQLDTDSTPNNNDPQEDDQAIARLDPQQIDLSLTKTVDDATPNANQNVTYTITLANAGPDAATNVAVTDLLPAGLTFVSSTPSQGTYVSGTGVWTVGTVNSGANATLSIVATVTTSGVKTNTAEVTAADQADIDSTPGNNLPAEDDQASVAITPTIADLSLTKTVNDSTPALGANVTFTITVSNAGPDSATNVAVQDLLPAGLTFVSSTPSQGTYNDGTGAWTVGAINSGASATLAIVATVATGGVKTNVAEVSDADQFDPDSTPGNNNAAEDDQASASVTPEPQIDLSLTKTVDDATPNRNQNVTFTITLANAGPDTATNVAVTDLLPAGLTFVSSTPSQGTYVSGTGIWTVGTVNSGANATLTVVATVTTSGVKINTAEVTAADQTDVDSTPNNQATGEDDQASVTVSPNVADLSVTKTVDDATPDRNQNVTFTITTANAGPQTATGVSVTDLLPAGLTFVSSTPSQGTYDSGTGVWTIGSINSGANATLTVVATVTTSGVKTNTAQVSAADTFDPDSTPGNNNAAEDDQASVSVTPNVADLSLTKTVDNAAPNPGQNVTFLITLSNAGPQTATGVNVLDLLPAGLTFVSSTPSVGTYAAGTGIWTVGSLNSGANATLQIVATVAASPSIINTAQVSAADAFDPDSTPGNSIAGEDDQASVTVVSQRFSKRLFLAR